MEEQPQGFAASDTFRHVAFIGAILLLLGAWKFGLEGVLE